MADVTESSEDAPCDAPCDAPRAPVRPAHRDRRYFDLLVAPYKWDGVERPEREHPAAFVDMFSAILSGNRLFGSDSDDEEDKDGEKGTLTFNNNCRCTALRGHPTMMGLDAYRIVHVAGD